VFTISNDKELYHSDDKYAEVIADMDEFFNMHYKNSFGFCTNTAFIFAFMLE